MVKEVIAPTDFDSQDDPLFLQVNSQVGPDRTAAGPAAKDFNSQDDQLFLQVPIPQYPSGTCRVVGVSADTATNVVNSNVAAGIDHSRSHQIGRESVIPQHYRNPTGNSILKSTCQMPSHPVTKVSSRSDINTQLARNAYPSRLVSYPQVELKNLSLRGGINVLPVDSSKAGFKNVLTCQNEVGGFSSIPANIGEAFHLKIPSNVNYLDDTSHKPVEKKSTDPTKDAKGEKQRKESLKHLTPGSNKSNLLAKKYNKTSKGKSKALEMYEKAELVYFDLETGGLFVGVDILQIAAASNGHSFMQYVTPTKCINAEAQDINGLKNENGTLMKRTSRIPLTWEPLETLPIEKSLQNFLDWLDSTGPCFLVAHNASFDKRHLLYQVKKSGLYGEFQKRVLGFVDTLPFFRAMYPELRKPGPGHRQEVLVKHILQESYNAHDALEDVKSLQKLVEKVDAPRANLLKHKKHF